MGLVFRRVVANLAVMTTRDPEAHDIHERRTRYDHWLHARAEPCAEVMRGAQTMPLTALRLTRDGLAALGFSGALPTSFVPEALMAGGYDEDRDVYDSPVFAGTEGERRTVHLALDIFAPAGAEVFAPLDGRVHSFQDNANPLDYGPTLILEHAVSPELTFWTLYGHLSRDSLAGWSMGRMFKCGERLGRLGAPDVNGGWAPHLHFQVMLDIGDRYGDYPGVFRRSERDRWRALCPDPADLLGIRLAS